ncbi:hypothetical protein [Chryseobacterium cheonjiense]|uniref:Lipoprotein n=1 Tax=Chryseobacterium cheonjiense TaxID=2728845 RepID=A0A7Y0A3Y1_9FLAO|nr:hypothetical protein [Chryseobacterium cheonjiense]NML56219.1 hypothetical protein [Chryseobacterium cheonjiense]
MKNHVFLLIIALFLTGCGSGKFTVKRRIIKVYENDSVKVLVADNNDIIETFKDEKGKKCKEIVLGKKYKFKVYPVSDLFQGCYFEPTYFLDNDTVTIKYARYFTASQFKNYCIKNNILNLQY